MYTNNDVDVASHMNGRQKLKTNSVISKNNIHTLY